MLQKQLRTFAALWPTAHAEGIALSENQHKGINADEKAEKELQTVF